MSVVRVLPPEVIAKIAAGEVVERPASVVKELLENALDAQATSIEIRLKEAGKQLIQIKDNGDGIDAADLETIFLRHATSKIQHQDDLFNIHSLGFRGEALYSVAAVADIELKSRHHQHEDGWQIHYRGGALQNKQPVAMAHAGTDIKVHELFFNTPARKKFLKSNVSEMNAILNVVLPLAMMYPQVRFFVENNNKIVVDVAPSTFKKRFAQLLNLQEKHLIEDSYTYRDDQIKIHVILSDINVQRKRRDLQYLFINERPVTNRNLEFQINDIYRLIFPAQVYGAFAVFIDLKPDRVDVNIHPTKREVKIRDEHQVSSMLRRMVEQALMSKGSPKTIEDVLASPSSGSIESGIPTSTIIFGPSAKSMPMEFVAERKPRYTAIQPQKDTQTELFEQTASESLHDRFARSRYLGQFMRKFLLFEVDQSLIFVDQHAAQERIMFERFRKQINESTIEVQPLLSPITLSLSPQEKVAWDEVAPVLSEAGFETTLFDDNTVAIQAHPVLIKNPLNAVRAVLAEKPHQRCEYDTIARRACKASIVTGDKLSPEQALHQREQLLACDDPFTCPHGRPTLIDVKESFLDKQFLRI